MRLVATAALLLSLSCAVAANDGLEFESTLTMVISKREALRAWRAVSGDYYRAAEQAHQQAQSVSGLRRDLEAILKRISPDPDPQAGAQLKELAAQIRARQGPVGDLERELYRLEGELRMPDLSLLSAANVLHWEAVQLSWRQSRKLKNEALRAVPALTRAGFAAEAAELEASSASLRKTAANIEYSATRIQSFHERDRRD